MDVPATGEEGGPSSSAGAGRQQRVFLCPARLTLGQLLGALQRDACCAAAGSVLADIQGALQVSLAASLCLLTLLFCWTKFCFLLGK